MAYNRKAFSNLPQAPVAARKPQTDTRHGLTRTDDYAWFRADGNLPDIPALHKYLLAYASDFGLLTTSLLPHGKSVWQRDMQIASLDHTIWFHRPFRMDEWLLFAMDSPNASGGRGLCFAHVYNREGVLVATLAQEGLIRLREKIEKK